MKAVAEAADNVREHRRPAANDIHFFAFQETVSKNIVNALDKWRDAQETLSESLFSQHLWIARAAGCGRNQADADVSAQAGDVARAPRASRGTHRRAEVAHRKGGFRECVIRGLLNVGMARGMVDERSLEALRRARADDDGSRLTLAQFKMMVTRAVLHAAAGAGGEPRCHPETAAGKRGPTP